MSLPDCIHIHTGLYQAMVHTSWHRPPNFMLYILTSTEDDIVSPDERDAVDAAFLLTHQSDQDVTTYCRHTRRRITI